MQDRKEMRLDMLIVLRDVVHTVDMGNVVCMVEMKDVI